MGDILESIDAIEQRLSGLSLDDLLTNEMLAKSILYDFIIIGEATSKIPLALQSSYPLIPWREMGAMRNRIAHEYFQLSLEII